MVDLKQLKFILDPCYRKCCFGKYQVCDGDSDALHPFTYILFHPKIYDNWTYFILRYLSLCPFFFSRVSDGFDFNY